MADTRRQIIEIDFAKPLTEEQQALLHRFLLQDEKKEKGKKKKIFEQFTAHHFENISLKFSHTVVRQTQTLPHSTEAVTDPITKEKKYSYNVVLMAPENQIGASSSSQGSLYHILGELTHQNNRIVFQPLNSFMIKSQFMDTKDAKDAKEANNIAVTLAKHTETKKMTTINIDLFRKKTYTTTKYFEKIPLDEYLRNAAITKISDCMYLTVLLCEALQTQVIDQGIVHRDIKPENIIVDTRQLPIKINIIDFDSCAKMNSDKKLKAISYFWVAPDEAYNQSGNINQSKFDSFALGLILRKIWGDPTFELDNIKLDQLSIVQFLEFRWKEQKTYAKKPIAISDHFKEQCVDFFWEQSHIDLFNSILKGLTHPEQKNRMSFEDAVNQMKTLPALSDYFACSKLNNSNRS